MSPQKLEKPFIDELFEGIEKRYKSPSPQLIAGQVERFERLLNCAVLPFLGINAFLLGSIAYRRQVGSILVPVALSGALIIGWLALFPRYARRAAWMHIGGLAALAVMAFLAVPNLVIALALSFAWTAGLTLAITCKAIPEKSIIVYVVYLPLLVHAQLPAETRITFELLTLVPMSVLFLACRLRIASLTTLASAVVIGSLELSRVGRGDLGLVALMGAFLIVSAVYEWRIPRIEVSSLREFAGHGLMILLSFVTIVTLLDPSEPLTWWIWASATVLFQVMQMIRERLADPTRAGWISLTLALCLWTQAPNLQWHVKVLGTLALAAAVHMLATALSRRFLATLALALAGSTAFVIVPKSYDHVSVHVLTTCALVVGFLLLVTRAWPGPEPVPWWRGFLHADHTEWVRRFSLGVLSQLMRIPTMWTLFGWFRNGFMWLKYLKGEAETFSVSDLTFAAANVLGALVVSNQLSILLIPNSAAGEPAVLVLSAVWLLWGLSLVVAGSRRRVLYYRLLGAAFLAYPIVTEVFFVRSEDQLALALLALITGLAMWLTGAATRRVAVNDVENLATHETDDRP